MMRTTTRVAAGLGVFVLVALASVTAFVPKGICAEHAPERCRGTETLTGATLKIDTWMYDANRDLIENENEMINHRMMWLLTIQGFLFASFFLVWRWKRSTGSANENIRLREIYVIYLLGVFSAVSVGITMFFGINAIKCIIESTPEAGRQYVIGLGHGSVPVWVHYLLPWNSLSALFVLAWQLLVEAETDRVM